ncbi:MAG: TIM barrel protein [Armatimonadia bacterium]|nr:TIM barrel protein [Armatimonadia bacterium]
MYAAIRDGVLLHAGYKTIGEGLRELDIQGIELAIDRDMTVHAIDPAENGDRLDLSRPEGIDALRSQCRMYKARICALLMANNFGADDVDFEVQWTVDTAKAAAVLGVPVVRIDAIMHGEKELPLEKRQDIFHGAMARILDATADLDVEFGIENHGYQGNDPEFLEGVFERAGNPRLGLTMDTGNFYWWGHPLDEVYKILERLAPHTKHTHVKNINYPPETRQEHREMGWEYGKYVSPIPDGDIDHTKLVGYLKAIGYDRDFTIEDESLGKFAEGEGRLEVVRRDVEYVKSIL